MFWGRGERREKREGVRERKELFVDADRGGFKKKNYIYANVELKF